MPKEFYKLEPVDVDYATQHRMAMANGLLTKDQNLQEVKDSLVDIESAIKSSDDYQNLFQGLAIPSVFDAMSQTGILALNWKNFGYHCKKNYEQHAEGAYFKATLQGNTQLRPVRFSSGVGYETFLEDCSRTPVVGYYSNGARIRYQISTCKNCRPSKPADLGVCLSGPFELFVLAHPKLLLVKVLFTDIVCISIWNALTLEW